MDKETEILFKQDIPFYGENSSIYGFIAENSAMPSRKVDLAKLFWHDGAVCIAEEDHGQFAAYHHGATDYDLGGMILRMDLEPEPVI